MTDAQAKAVNSKKTEILVSAAAGAGKTTVLTNRILRHVKNNVPLSNLLVVTYTEAASLEMNERITEELGKLGLPPALAQTAEISTIHAFCRKLIINNFQLVDLDPAFKIGEAAELEMVAKKVMKELFEEEYEKEDADFLDLVEVYGGKLTDIRLDALIRRIHEFLESAPYPEIAAKKYIEAYENLTPENFDDSKWVEIIKSELETTVQGAVMGLNQAMGLCKNPHGPMKYCDTLQREMEMLSGIIAKIKNSRFQELYGIFLALSWERLPSITKKDDVDEELKNRVQRIRNNGVKKRISSLVEGVFFAPPQKMASDITALAPRVKALLLLTRRFAKKYEAEKRAKNILDFSDLEHFALEILYPDGPDSLEPSKLVTKFDEVLVDEYQDSNDLQDLILSAVAHRKFMVGDVKQSIYRFRRANPGIFMEMYRSFSHGDKNKERIDLSHNFRSHPPVLDAVNFIFGKICCPEVGEVEYDEASKLYAGLEEYPELNSQVNEHSDDCLGNVSSYTERRKENHFSARLGVAPDGKLKENFGRCFPSGVHEKMRIEIYDENTEEMDDEEVANSETLLKGETNMIADRIHEMLDTREVWDKDAKIIRKCRLGDIVILTRSVAGIAGIVLSELKRRGIDAVAESNTGFFEQTEIKTMLALLRIIDNPRQDIELIAVLVSPVYGFTPDELHEIACIKAVCEPASTGLMDDALESKDENGALDFYDKLLLWKNDKGEKFLDDLHKFRQASFHMGASRLLGFVLTATSYPSYVASMPGAGARLSNLRLLQQKAIQFEESGRHSLFMFVLHLAELQASGKLSASQGSQPAGNNFVRLMTIHKSKGLEFPIVFVSFLSKQFNKMDMRSSIVLHPDFGLGPYYIDLNLRTRANTLPRFSLAKHIYYQGLSEEMRCLYVAMTRAMQMLVLTAGVKDYGKSFEKWMDGVFPGEKVPAFYLRSAGCFLDWVMPCVLGEEDCGGFDVRVYRRSQREGGETAPSLTRSALDASGLTPLLGCEEEIHVLKALPEPPFAFPSKLSISEIKRLYNITPDSEVLHSPGGLRDNSLAYNAPIFEPPAFLLAAKKISPAEIGQAIHSILEHIDYHRHRTKETVSLFLQGLLDGNFISKEAFDAIDVHPFLQLVNSGLGDRLRSAETVFRETPFILAVLANRVYNTESCEKIVVHGIIDCHFVENGKIVLVDFKNDRIQKNMEPGQWAKTHELQLSIYREALMKSTGMECGEVLLYSFHLGKSINVEMGKVLERNS